MGKNLNLGCGRDYRPGWQNWDISKEVRAEHHLDITKDPWPADNEAFDSIYCSGVLEQILENEKLVYVLNECRRVLAHGGILTVIVPSAKFSNAFKDPHDVRQFTEATFKYFTAGTNEHKLYGSVYGYKPWKLLTVFTKENGIMTVELQKP